MPAVPGRPAPTLETPRLLLRAPAPADFPASLDAWTDPRVTRYVGGRSYSPEEVWAKLLRYAGLWSMLGFGYWAVVDRETDRYVGEVGFADFKRDLEPSLGDAPEIGWVLASWAHGRGLATEAVNAAIAWGDRELAGRRTVCIIAPENLASIRVARKAGYAEVGQVRYKESPALLYRR